MIAVSLINCAVLNCLQIGSLDDYYLLARRSHPSRSKRAATAHTQNLIKDARVCCECRLYNIDLLDYWVLFGMIPSMSLDHLMIISSSFSR